MTRYTPGPWNVCEPTTWPDGYALPAGRLHGTWSVGTRPGVCLAFVSGTDAEVEANARLIAAAPTMLETLEELDVGLQYWLESVGDHGGRIVNLLGQVRAALLAAQGEHP